MAETRMRGEYIQDFEQLERVTQTLNGAETLFLDTEFESYRGGTELSLIQVTDGVNAFVIDAMSIRDLTSLRETFGHSDIMWVVHAGKQDVALLMDALKIRRRPDVFDTQVAWSLVGPEHQVSLAYLEAVLLGVRKGKGRQTDNWKRRPLTDEQLAYALGDVTNMPAMYDALIVKLERLDRVDLVVTVSRETFEPVSSPKRSVSLASYRNLWQLDGSQKAVLSALVHWYNAFEDKVPGGTPHYKSLFSIASRLPETVQELGEIKGVNMGWAKRSGESVLDLIEDNRISGQPEMDAEVPTPYGSYDDYFRDAWLSCARADISATLSMAPEVAFAPWLMKRLRAEIKTGRTLKDLGREFIGWRSMIQPTWDAFCEETAES